MWCRWWKFQCVNDEFDKLYDVYKTGCNVKYFQFYNKEIEMIRCPIYLKKLKIMR